jgi:hypothetical protein
MSDVTEKIRKLMNLADQSRNSNANESAAAAAMAAELALKYNINLDAIGREGTKAETKQFKKGDWAPTIALPRDKQTHLMLASGVAALYGCKFLIYVFHNSNRIAFIGQPHNVDLCNKWLEYLWKAMARSNTEYARTRTFDTKKERYTADCGFRLQFAAQVSSRLREKLEAMKAKGVADGGGTALMVVNWYEAERREVQEWMDKNLSMGKPTQIRGKKIDTHAARAGYDAGNKVGLDDQIKGPAGKSAAPGMQLK